MRNQKQLSEDEEKLLENETRIKELKNLNQRIYEIMESYTGQRLILTTLEAAAENIQECIKKIEQW